MDRVLRRFVIIRELRSIDLYEYGSGTERFEYVQVPKWMPGKGRAWRGY